MTGKLLCEPIIIKLPACNKLDKANARNLAWDAEYPTPEGACPKRSHETLGKYGRKMCVVQLRQKRPRMFNVGSTRSVPII